jgi:HPt (histidine-containing phosphotransfer) domain-containing protein
MNDHLPKPIDTHALVKVLAKWIDRKPLIPEPTEGGRVSIFQEDEALYKKLLGDFHKAWSPQEEFLVGGLRSLDKQIHQTIHTLKGVSGNLDLRSLYEACVSIDTSFKKDLEITDEQIEQFKVALEEALEFAKTNTNLFAIDQSLEGDLQKAKDCYEELYQALSEFDMVSYDFQCKCMEAFAPFVQKDSLLKWQKAMDALDYESAKSTMESWDLKDRQ